MYWFCETLHYENEDGYQSCQNKDCPDQYKPTFKR